MFKQSGNVYDYIIIGAGISGLYLGKKLIEKFPGQRILILEKLDRVGGRADSVPIEGLSYVAEGCALRYYHSQTKIIKLLDEYKIKGIEVPRKLPINDEIEDDTISNILLENRNNTTRSNLDIIVNSPSIEEGDYSNLSRIVSETGYTSSSYLMNVQQFLSFISPPTSSTQFFVEGGFMNLFNKMYEELSSYIDIILDIEVISVEHSDGYFSINDGQYISMNRVLWTGNRHDLNILNTNSKLIRNKKKILYNYIGTEITYLTLYLQVENPWWSKDDVLNNYTSNDNPINSLFYWDNSIIRLYLDMKNAELFMSMIPFEYRDFENRKMKWIEMNSKSIRLEKFIQKYINELVDHFPKITKYTFKYTRESSIKIGLINNVEKMLDFLNYKGNFNLISGDYTNSSGWIESCLTIVDDFVNKL